MKADNPRTSFPLATSARVRGGTITATHAQNCPARHTHDADDCICTPRYRVVRSNRRVR